MVSKVDRLTRSVAFLSRLLEAGVDVRFADLPQIEGATGRFLLQQMVAVAELEAGMISARTKAALAAAKRRGKKLGGLRRKIVGKDAKGKPIYGDVAKGSAKAQCGRHARSPGARCATGGGCGADHRAGAGGRENIPASHRRRTQRARHSDITRRR